jgi:hypothetical protein
MKSKIWEEFGLYTEYEGIVTKKTLEDSDKVFGDSRFDDLTWRIIDLSKVTKVDFGIQSLELKAIQSDTASVWNKNLYVIFVINETVKPTIEKYKKLMKHKKNDWKIIHFETKEKARTFAGEVEERLKL